ncbi:MAG: lamin tail domain-containing protein [Chloroflexi bacterium]|nr:lamin tail domain-containing protein [Chloroflexota bacterium]
MANQPQISSFSSSIIAELTIIISEIAWSGTFASSSDEWIELYNPGKNSIDLAGWRLVSNDGSPDIKLEGSIAPGEFYLLERSDDNTVSNIAANIIYSGALGNSGETLYLLGPSGETVDTVNLSGGNWPAGDSSTQASMERTGFIADSSSAWATHNGSTSNAHDANDDTIMGSPKAANSVWSTNPTTTPTATPSSTNSLTSTNTSSSTATMTPSPTPTHTSTSIQNQYVVINEIAWSGTDASTGDEWIELYNYGSQPVDLSNWSLGAADGTPVITLNGVISSGNFFLLERTNENTISNISADQIYTGPLGNSGESLLLRDAGGNLIDSVNIDGDDWPGGTSSSGTPQYATLERTSIGASDSNWGTNNGITRNGEDANGNPINGTPKSANSTIIKVSYTNTATASPTETPTSSPSPSATSTSTPSPSITNSATLTRTPTLSSTSTPTNTASPTSTTDIIVPGTVIINEIAWSGTTSSSFDEWIELYNPTTQEVDLTGWALIANDGLPNIELIGTVSGDGYFILERTDDNTISDTAANQIYSGTLSNSGETLELYSPSGVLIDTANISGGAWPAGDIDQRVSMERHANSNDSPSAWGTNNGAIISGHDSQGNAIQGSPGQPNSLWFSTPTPSPTQTPSPTITPTASGTIQLVAPLTVWINEIAWSGTIGHYNDEWIELFNPGYEEIDLLNWTLVAADGSPEIHLEGKITSWGYYILERTDDSTIANIDADQIYTGSLSNNGETLYLNGPNGELVDTASQSDGSWPAGNAEHHKTMERRGTSATGRALWNTNNGYVTNGLDVDGYPIWGTPKNANSNWFPTPTPTQIPEGTRILINEFLPHPKYDWNRDGKFTSNDEFIELINAGTTTINLEGWLLDDIEEGSTPYEIPNIELAPGEIISFFRSETGISLSDSGDEVRLLIPDGTIADVRAYNFAKDVNLTWCRLPDGIKELAYPCWPTPNKLNGPYERVSPIQEDVLIPVTGNPREGNIFGIQPGWLIPKGSRICGYR